VVSTTGNGDPPDHQVTGCDKWWRFLKRRAQPKDLLDGMRYTVLGLGDTNYDKFWCVRVGSVAAWVRRHGEGC
jgi:sulfite reductase alpha subunit-like flavoprotein